MIARVLLRFILSLLLASVVIFLLLRLIPGDPARVALGVTATDEAVAALSRQLGTDRPLLIQYVDWVRGLMTGNFGISLASRQDITPLIVDRAQVSLILCGLAMALSLVIALPLGMWAARRDDRVISALAQVGIAVPSFLTGILLVTVFAVHLGWVPANGWIPPGTDFPGFLQRIILPVIALTLVQAAILTRYVRSAVLDVLDREYIRTARSTGASVREALWRHGLRNASLPVLTVAGLQLTSLIVGAVVIERVFLIPGLGSMLLDSVARRDLTAVQTIVMLLVVFTLTVNLVVDVTYRLIDPRLRRSA
ncbi:MAG: ABC transporter permease [Corynebacterium humireducens]|uniref:ABC transporter permease n=2 Tax=Corynebacterium humireducens TaxID=1223514 RepID=A0A0B5DDC7_9CORY|nr:ABC transporter permease [Corynebacterium humireducens]AJE33779.1 ABC transporter permease [Corynebacterium humireducens NBRC 106098 = DSM 45392]NLA55478.1 ABC transporter permease [Corynebacterium humireducens]